jgi:hypothetical protein
MPRLEFSQVHRYRSTAGGITMPVALRSGSEVSDLVACLDTGASNCLFWTATGGVNAFGHVVELDVLGLTIESMVYFFGDERINKNLLGRAHFGRPSYSGPIVSEK